MGCDASRHIVRRLQHRRSLVEKLIYIHTYIHRVLQIMYVCMFIYSMCGCMYLCTYLRIYAYFQCMYDMTCGICFSSSDCDGFAMSSIERVVKVSDWSLQAILSIDSMALLLTIGSPTYIHTCMRSENRRP